MNVCGCVTLPSPADRGVLLCLVYYCWQLDGLCGLNIFAYDFSRSGRL